MVEIQAPSSSRARSLRPRSANAARMRVRSSPAARRVYVITRIESTSSPRSQTARTKRSTMTAVLPVPAPAETNTSPVASTAARCCSVNRASGVRVLAGLVVLADPGGAERILVDPVDLAGEAEPVAEIEPARELRRRALAPEEHLEPPRHERELRLAFGAHDCLEIA